MDENISRAAGANHGQTMTEGRFGEIIAPLRRTLAQRNTAYKLLSPT
jgi:FO synthase